MKFTFIRICLIAMVFALLGNTLISQTTQMEQGSHSHWEFGLQLGFGQYYGDVSDKSYFKKLGSESRFSGLVLARRHFNDRYAIGAQIQSSGLYSVKENFSNGSPANFEFSARVFEAGIHAYLNFSNLFWGAKARKVTVYGTLGIGFISWNGSLKDSQTQNVIFENGSNIAGLSYKTSGAVIPATLGLSYALNDQLSIDFNGSIHTVLSDDLDFYADGFKNDILVFTHLGLSYHLNAGRSKRTKIPTKSANAVPLSFVDYDNVKSKQPESKPAQLPVIELEMAKETPKTFEFRVQILAVSKPMHDVKSYFSGVTFEYPIVVANQQGLYRYSTGSFSNFSDASSYAEQMKRRGIHDAFVVAYRNNQRIPITSEMKQ